jgi:hypothetical protein
MRGFVREGGGYEDKFEGHPKIRDKKEVGKTGRTK